MVNAFEGLWKQIKKLINNISLFFVFMNNDVANICIAAFSL